jgi:hypothetical protein
MDRNNHKRPNIYKNIAEQQEREKNNIPNNNK